MYIQQKPHKIKHTKDTPQRKKHYLIKDHYEEIICRIIQIKDFIDYIKGVHHH